MSGLLDLPDWLGKPFAVVLIDLLLAGDNALVIGLVCASLPKRDRRWVLVFGTVGAIVLRVVLAGLAGGILAIPGLKLVGGFVLVLLAMNLATPEASRPAVPAASALDERSSLLAGAVLVTLVDVLMSLDNVLALAAVAGGSVAYLAGGLLLSVSLPMFASTLVAGLLARFSNLTRLGAAVLGWVAGAMSLSDAWLQDWVATQAPLLGLLVPGLVALYVYLVGGRTVAAPDRVRRAAPEPGRAAPPVRAAARQPAAASERMPLIVFTALFVVVGALLAVLSVLGGGTIP